MAYPIKWMGWGRYTNTGERYRLWKFTEDVPDVGAEVGDSLHNQTSGEGGFRWAVAKAESRGGWWKDYDADTIAEVVFGREPPAWDPPRETDGGTGMGTMNPTVTLALTQIASSLNRLSDAYTKDVDLEAKGSEQPHPRGVYVFDGEGRWGRDLLVAFDSEGNAVAKQELREEETEEERVVFASNLQRRLDRLDPPPPPEPGPDFEALVDEQLSSKGRAPFEPFGRTLLHKQFEEYRTPEGYRDWQPLARFDHWRDCKPRPCAACGEMYRPAKTEKSKTLNTRRCRTCIDASKNGVGGPASR
ncbi:MAG: hypothetical protein GEU90_00590 [Gemmatimonas sp.]|nr:hypothetical protein [Gemmatimonas sp.]